MPVLPDPNETSQRSHRSDGPEPAAIALFLAENKRKVQKERNKWHEECLLIHKRTDQFPEKKKKRLRYQTRKNSL